MRHNFRRFVMILADSAEERDRFRENPEAYMSQAGLADDEKAVSRIPDPKKREDGVRAMLSEAVARGQIVILFDDGS